MAAAVVSVIVERVATIIEDKIRYEVNLVRGVKDELRDLSKKLVKIREVLDDAEKRGVKVKEQRVKSWLKELESTTYEMDDILDEWNYYLLKHKMEASVEPNLKVGCSFIPSSCLRFKKVVLRRYTAKKMKNVKDKFSQILKEMDEFKFVNMLNSDSKPESWRGQSTCLIDLKKVHGLDIHRKKNDIVNKLMLNVGDIQILSIVGTGGLGKTTLAQLIFNDPRFENDWLKIWVCVSDPFVVAEVAKNIVDCGKRNYSSKYRSIGIGTRKIKSICIGKKFLLVLDDVWTEEENKWKYLKICLQCGAAGSKIIVTTRNERVAKMMGTLHNDAQISLVMKSVGHYCVTHPFLERARKNIENLRMLARK